MRKLLLAICIMVMACSTSFGAKVPDDVRNYINNNVPNADIRFDGVIVFPSNTVYLPLFPSLFSDVKTLSIKETYPAGRDIRQEPDVIIFNNDFVLMKVLTDGTGHRTVAHLNNPPLQVRTGLLPQDMLVPSGLIIPENIKGIIGNLKIDTKNEDVIKVENSDAYEDFVAKGSHAKSQGVIPLLKNKTVKEDNNG